MIHRLTINEVHPYREVASIKSHSYEIQKQSLLKKFAFYAQSSTEHQILAYASLGKFILSGTKETQKNDPFKIINTKRKTITIDSANELVEVENCKYLEDGILQVAKIRLESDQRYSIRVKLLNCSSKFYNELMKNDRNSNISKLTHSWNPYHNLIAAMLLDNGKLFQD